jgi:CRISPR-associated protein Cmr2
MMNMDSFSALSEEQNATIKNVIQLENRMKDENDENGKLASEERTKLLVPNAHHTYHLLAVIDENKASANNFRSAWQKKNLQIDLGKDIKEWGLDGLILGNLVHPAINLSLLPAHSFVIQFTFALKTPYISRDEQEFHIIDNPLCKDRVFGLPYVAPSSWKGSLRAAFWQLGCNAKDDEMRRIFGNERAAEEQKELRAGRLHFFPTFFTKKGLEVINPHSRERRVGTVPILMESVPGGTSGLFTILYVTFDLIGKEENETKKQVSVDMQLICKGLKAMFTDYGFGAKTSSGYGIVKPDLSGGTVTLRDLMIVASQKEIEKPQPPEEGFKKYLEEDGSVKEEFKGGGEYGLLSSPEYHEKGEQLGGGGFKEFKRFKRWYIETDEQRQKHLKSKDDSKSEWPIWAFARFEGLEELTEQIGILLNTQEAP